VVKKLSIIIVMSFSLLVMGAKCTTTEGLPIHTKVYWLTADPGEDIIFGHEPPIGEWVKVGRTYGDQDVWMRRHR
jgi:hypothetical protein